MIPEVLREQKRNVDRSVRQLEQERMKLKGQEGKLIADMKKHAKANELKSVKIMAKDLIRIRKHQEKFLNLQAQLRAVSLQMQTMSSTQAFAESMKNATLSMRKMNAQMRLPVLQKIMMEFQKQSEIMGMSQEMMGDAIDDALADEDEEEETENVVNQVCIYSACVNTRLKIRQNCFSSLITLLLIILISPCRSSMRLVSR